MSIFNSRAPDGVVLDTVLASYASPAGPASDTERKACDKGVASFGTTALTGDSRFASLDGSKKVTIPSGATISVYVAAEKAFNPAQPGRSTGPVKLSVKTEALAP